MGRCRSRVSLILFGLFTSFKLKTYQSSKLCSPHIFPGSAHQISYRANLCLTCEQVFYIKELSWPLVFGRTIIWYHISLCRWYMLLPSTTLLPLQRTVLHIDSIKDVWSCEVKIDKIFNIYSKLRPRHEGRSHNILDRYFMCDVWGLCRAAAAGTCTASPCYIVHVMVTAAGLHSPSEFPMDVIRAPLVLSVWLRIVCLVLQLRVLVYCSINQSISQLFDCNACYCMANSTWSPFPSV